MADTLTTQRTTRPGVYIGRVNRTNPSGLNGFARLPAYVGRGSRLRTLFNQGIRRSYLFDQVLMFPPVAPHLIPLVYAAVNDQTIANLFRSDGTIVPASKWKFIEGTAGSGIYNQVLLAPEAFDITVSYSLDYQSTSRSIKDALPFDNIRQVRFIGDTENQEKYVEFTHYYIPVTTTDPSPGSANSASGVSDVGFEPAKITSALNTVVTFTAATDDILALKFDGGPTFTVTFSPAVPTTRAEMASAINTVIGTAGTAYVDASDYLVLQSNSVDPGSSSVFVDVGVLSTASIALGFTSTGFDNNEQFPTAAMSGVPITTGGFVRQTAGSGSRMLVTSTSSSNHLYNRRYRLTVVADALNVLMDLDVLHDSGASIPAVTSGSLLSLGDVFNAGASGTQPQVPFHETIANTSTRLDFGLKSIGGVHSAVSFTDITGDKINFVLEEPGVLGTVPGDVFELSSVGPSIIELDSALQNTEQHSSFSAVSTGTLVQTGAPNYVVSIGAAPTGTGTASLRPDAEYTGAYNRRYLLTCTAASVGAAVGLRTATFVWQAWGEVDDLQYGGSSHSFSIDESLGSESSVNLGDGVFLEFTFDPAVGGIGNFLVDDVLWLQANAAKTFVTAKDDRHFQLDVAAVGLDASTGNNTVAFSYQTGTPEGSFGIVSATGPQGNMFLSGGVNIWARNVGSQTSFADRFAVNDQWIFDTVTDDVVDWSLTTLTTETIDPTQIVTDSLGLITGTVGLKYVILSHAPTTMGIKYIKDTATLNLIPSYSISSGQPYVAFPSAPTSPIEVRYEYIGDEVAPAGLYYITANTVRPASLYNTPIRVLSYESAAQLLGPSSKKNDLLIMAQLALDDNNAPGSYFVQAFDGDGDGVITSIDVNTAISSTADERNLTDVIVLSSFGSLSKSMSNNEKMNDPFERGERALWVGAPIGTAIGSESAAGTLIFLAQKTLQVFGENHAHGKRVLIGNTEAKKTIVLTDGTQVSVDLDGSFIAGAFAARNASFSDPGETLLRKNLFGFDYIKTYTEPEELQLIGASMVFVSDVGDDVAPVYRIEESTTVDRSSDDNNEISVAINQKEFVTREIRTNMDRSLISIVPPSEQAGVALIQSFLVANLQSLLARGIIGSYSDSSGASRPLDPDEDVEVFRSKDSRTAYNFRYFWNGRYPLKRLFGLYSVDRKFFGSKV